MQPRIDDLASDRQRRLFACACCRSIWRLLRDERSCTAVEVAEHFADGLASDEQLRAARAAALEVLVGPPRPAAEAPPLPGRPPRIHPDALALHSGQAENPAAGAALDTAHAAADTAAGSAAELAVEAVSDWRAVPEAEEEEGRKQDRFLADIVRPAAPPQPLPPAVLEWNDRTVPRLAEAIYEERRMPKGTLDNVRLAILADALTDAGCDDVALIQHCRDEGPHVRGCWAVDRVLGKQ